MQPSPTSMRSGYAAQGLIAAVRYEGLQSRAAILRSIARASEAAWHARLHVAGEDIEADASFLEQIKGITCEVDHMAHLYFEKGLDQPACRWLVRMMKDHGWWVMLSNGNRDSKMESGWDDAVPFGRMFVEAAPDQFWGTDWPHVSWRKRRMMNDAETVELLYR